MKFFQFSNSKFQNCKFQFPLNRGVTYIELIVVLSIFVTMTSMVVYNYANFQSQVDIRNLASEIALRLVDAQKSALSGELPGSLGAPASWRPKYGVRFDESEPEAIYYFADLDDDGSCAGSDCASSNCAGECIEKVKMTRGNHIFSIEVEGVGCSTASDLNVVFIRPNSAAVMNANNASGDDCGTLSYAAVRVASSNDSVQAEVQIFSSGRIQID